VIEGYSLQLNCRKLVVFNSPALKLFSHVWSMTISRGTLNTISLNESCGLRVVGWFLNGDERVILKEEAKNFLMT
jgi:hypothetical protein